jgi:hypothetical protein
LDADIPKTVGLDLDIVFAGLNAFEVEGTYSIGFSLGGCTLLVRVEHDMSPGNGGSGGVQNNSGKPGKGLGLIGLTFEEARMDETEKDQQSWKEMAQAKDPASEQYLIGLPAYRRKIKIS